MVDHGNAEGFGGGRVVTGDGLAIDADAAAVIGLVGTGEDLHQRRFAGAVLTHQGVNFTGIDFQADVLEHPQAIEGLADALHFKQGVKAHD